VAYRIAVRISLDSEFTNIYSFSGDIWNRLGDRRKAATPAYALSKRRGPKTPD